MPNEPKIEQWMREAARQCVGCFGSPLDVMRIEECVARHYAARPQESEVVTAGKMREALHNLECAATLVINCCDQPPDVAGKELFQKLADAMFAARHALDDAANPPADAAGEDDARWLLFVINGYQEQNQPGMPHVRQLLNEAGMERIRRIAARLRGSK